MKRIPRKKVAAASPARSPITPPPTPAPTPPPDETPEEPEDHAPLWALLLLLLAAALIGLRLALCAPERAARRYRNPGDSLLIWYRATEEALLCLGITAQPGEAPASFLLRAQEALGSRVKLLKLGKALCVARYSGHRLKAAQVACGRDAYRAVLGCMTIRQRLRLYTRRVRFGMKLR